MTAPPSSDAAKPTRRSFLRTSLFGGALLSLSWLVGHSLTGYELPRDIAKPRVLSDKELIVLGAVVARIVAPDGLDGAVRVRGLALASWLDGYLANLDQALRSDLRALLQFVEHGGPLFRLRATRFSRMSESEQDATLAAFGDSPLALRRQGLQALRSLAFLAYYRDDRTWPMLGYAGPMLPKVAP